MLNSMSVNNDFLTWLLIGWRLCCQPIRCLVWKLLFTNIHGFWFGNFLITGTSGEYGIKSTTTKHIKTGTRSSFRDIIVYIFYYFPTLVSCAFVLFWFQASIPICWLSSNLSILDTNHVTIVYHVVHSLLPTLILTMFLIADDTCWTRLVSEFANPRKGRSFTSK